MEGARKVGPLTQCTINWLIKLWLAYTWRNGIYASVHFMVRVTAKIIYNQGVCVCIQCTYKDHMHTQIPHDSESDGLDLESGESLHCPWLTRPALTYLQCNAMHYHTHTHTTPPALLQYLQSRPLGGWIMPYF